MVEQGTHLADGGLEDVAIGVADGAAQAGAGDGVDGGTDDGTHDGADGGAAGAGKAVRRVVFVGAESTGKSTLAETLARDYGSCSAPEVGRYIWEAKGGKLDANDYVEIALRHRAAEDAALVGARRFLFVDTNALTTLLLGIQFKQVGDPPPAELLRCADECKTRYAYTFVCADDIPYEEQDVRENEAWRGRIQALVLRDLEARGISYTIVRGSVEERAAQVRRVLEHA